MTRFTVTCPHCRALLELDGGKEVVVACTPAAKPRSTTSFDDRLQALSQEKQDAQAKLEEAMRAEKAGAEIREEKFRKALATANSEPISKPVRDMDLD